MLMEAQAEKEVKEVEESIQGMARSESSLHLRGKVGDLEEQYLLLQKECKEITAKQKQAIKLKMDKGIFDQLEDALALKECQIEIKETQLGKLNNLLQECEYNARKEESKV